MTEPAPHACRRRWSRKLDRAFTGALSARGIRALRRHAADCGDCRAVYDRLARAERAAYGSVFPAPALARVERNLVSPRRARRVWAPAGALAGAAAAILMWVLSGSHPTPEPDFRPRGREVTAGALAQGQRDPGVRLFCVDVEGGVAVVRGEVRLTAPGVPAPTLRCRIGDELQLAYSTPSLPGLTMVAFGHTSSGSTTWYAPSEAGESSVPVSTDVIDEPLGWSTRVEAAHRPGRYRVKARFFAGPIVAGKAARSTAALAEVRARLEIVPGEDVP